MKEKLMKNAKTIISAVILSALLIIVFPRIAMWIVMILIGCFCWIISAIWGLLTGNILKTIAVIVLAAALVAGHTVIKK